MSTARLLLSFEDYREPAERLANAADLAHETIERHLFPDGESLVRLPESLPAQVILCRSLDAPNAKLVELMLAADTARELGAQHLTLVAPYLGYMRQDKAFHPGEAVSQRIVGRFLAERFDALITVDPHLHRVHDLQRAVPVSRAVALSATEPMAAFLHRHISEPLLVGPDQESEQWVADIARHHGLDYAVATKHRAGDRSVSITLPEIAFRDREVVLVDDVASTGRTLAAAAGAIGSHRPRRITAIVAHALFVQDALDVIRRAGVAEIWSTDSVQHPTNRIHLAALLESAL